MKNKKITKNNIFRKNYFCCNIKINGQQKFVANNLSMTKNYRLEILKNAKINCLK